MVANLHRYFGTFERLAFGIALSCGPADSIYAFEACRVTVPPIVDGKLSDRGWNECVPATIFTQVLPRLGMMPSEATEVRVAYDEDSIYFGIRCYDSEPDKIIAKQLQHDGSFEADDYIYISLDTFGRARDGYYFAVNPAGARQDGLIGDFSRSDSRWDGLWMAKTATDDLGWTAEIAIPFTSLSFDPGNANWRWNIQRGIRRHQESIRLHAISPSMSVMSLSEFGPLPGVHGTQTGLGLELKPGVTFNVDKTPDEPSATEVRPSLDLTYYLTPSLKANATINTDFAEIEVDDRVLNLSRFPLFLPEKRDFFLQDAPLFSFGGINRNPLPYYSRRIGLSEEGEPVDIQYGGRLTGRAGPTSIALLGVRQDAHEDVDATTLLVGRVSTQFTSNFSAGAIGTHGNPTANTDNSLLGADSSWHQTDFLGDKELLIRGFVQTTDSEAFSAVDYAWGGDIDFPNEPFDMHLFFKEIGENYDPAMGFVSRRGIRNYIGSFRYTWRPNTDFVRSFSIGTRPEITTNLHGEKVAEEHDWVIFSIYSPAVDRYSLALAEDFDAVDEPFDILDQLVIPAGNYRFAKINQSIRTSSARALSVEVYYNFGGYYTGNRTSYGMDFEWRPSRFFYLSAGQRIQDIDLPDGDLQVQIVRSRARVSLTPDLSWSTLLQYDNQSREISVNSRVRWTYRPGGDVYFVVNNGWNYDTNHTLANLGTGVALKAGTTMRF